MPIPLHSRFTHVVENVLFTVLPHTNQCNFYVHRISCSPYFIISNRLLRFFIFELYTLIAFLLLPFSVDFFHFGAFSYSAPYFLSLSSVLAANKSLN